MSVFFEKFNVRWSDIDANRHVANSSYMEYCSHTRMSFLNSSGFGIGQLVRWNIGPVILKEEFTFYREIYSDQTVYVSLELTAMSEDANVFVFTHKIYDSEGVHHATSTAKGVWIDMIQRRRATPPDELKIAMLATADQGKLDIITVDDVKGLERPTDVNPEIFKI